MPMTTEATYRNCSVGGASTIGLMIALLDALVRDLRRAADAIHRDDIEGRCRELDHALLVIGQLESWADVKNGGEPARRLSVFYRYLRVKLMEASIRQSGSLLEALMETVLHVRSKWQLLDSAAAPVGPFRRDAVASHLASPTPAESERVPFSQLA